MSDFSEDESFSGDDDRNRVSLTSQSPSIGYHNQDDEDDDNNSQHHVWRTTDQNSSARSNPTPSSDLAVSRIGKKNKGPVRRAQLTPRVALYVPPYLQRQQQQAAAAASSTSFSNNKERGRVNRLSERSNVHEPISHHALARVKEKVKSYQAKQYKIVKQKSHSHTNNKRLNIENKKRKVNHVFKLPDSLWNVEMKKLLCEQNDHFQKYARTGCKMEKRKSKQVKNKLRALVRKARASQKPFNDFYKEIECRHAQIFGECEQTNVSVDDEVMFADNVSDISSYDEEEYDSSFYYSLTRRMSARLEWSQAILKFNSDPSFLKSPAIKEEVIESDDEESSVLEDDESGRRKSTNRNVEVRSSSSSNRTQHNIRRVPSAPDSSLDAAENEYLNQQFLRRQHDYEREQKFHQVGFDTREREYSFLSGPDESRNNFLHDRTRDSFENSFDKTLQDYRLHDLGRYKNHSAQKDFDTLLSIHRQPSDNDPVENVKPIIVEENCPQEPFRDSVRYKKPLPPSIIMERLDLGVYQNINDLASEKAHKSISRSQSVDTDIHSKHKSPTPTKHYPPKTSSHQVSPKRMSPYSERRAKKLAVKEARYPHEDNSVEMRYPTDDIIETPLRNYGNKRFIESKIVLPDNHSQTASMKHYNDRSYRNKEMGERRIMDPYMMRMHGIRNYPDTHRNYPNAHIDSSHSYDQQKYFDRKTDYDRKRLRSSDNSAAPHPSKRFRSYN